MTVVSPCIWQMGGGCKWQQVVDFPLCGLKRVSVASARASCQFEKLLEEIRCYIGEDNLTFISAAIGL